MCDSMGKRGSTLTRLLVIEHARPTYPVFRDSAARAARGAESLEAAQAAKFSRGLELRAGD
jgi:hypothetical protein